ncbi:MAG: hypothetical protein LBJ43_02370 [Propionibacteriaceae bacterium]|jgi:hypothetical protein|nr:hypothetical protein [Propionibacteriaceae bacterium]
MEFLAYLLVFAVLAAGVKLIVSAYQAAQKRRAQLIAFAADNGWTYTERDDSFTRCWKGKPFGHSIARATDVFQGQFGELRAPFAAFTYTYTEVSTDSKGNTSSKDYSYEVCVLQLPKALPHLSVSNEGVFTKLARFLGSQDIDFESDDFNRTYHIQSADTRFAYGVIHPQMMEWLLGSGRMLAPWRIDNTFLISYTLGLLNTTRVLQKLNTATTLVEQIPQYVWDDFSH